MFIRSLKVCALVWVCCLFAACGTQSGNSASPNNLPSLTTSSSITIDNAGVIPIIDNNPTTTIIYVHNSSNETINNISYNIHTNTNKNFTASLGQSPICSQMAARGVCPFGITITPLNKFALNGSLIITANYTEDGINHQFSQIINFKKVDDESDHGVKFLSGAKLDGFGNKKSYATIYAYGTGLNQDYLVESLLTSLPSTTIENGNITGQTIQSGFVQAIEVSSETPDKEAFSSSLTLQSSNSVTANNFSNTADFAIEPTNAPRLVAGLIPVIDTSTAIDTGEAIIVNAGGQSIHNITVHADGNFTLLSQCDSSIAAESFCNIEFQVPQYHGQGILTVSGISDDGQPISTSQAVIWFNSKENALVGLDIDKNPLTFPALSTKIDNITLTNLGGFDIESIDTSSVTIGGNATISSTTSQCTTISPSESCSYTIKVEDTKVEAGEIYLYIKGKYNIGYNQYEDYKRVEKLDYQTSANDPNITIAKPSLMEIEGNGIDSLNQVIIVTNNGSVDASITMSALNTTQLQGNVTINKIDDTCSNKTIPANGGQCSITVKLGPQINTQESALSSSNYITITYTGGTLTKPVTQTSEKFLANTLANQQKINLINVSAQNSDSGNGTNINPFIFFGGNSQTKSINLTYQNTGVSTLSIESITFNIESNLWSVSASTCNGAVLSPKGSCSITLTNLFAQNILKYLNVGSVFNMNLPLPTFTYTNKSATGISYTATPTFNGSNLIYVTEHQATISNQLTIGSLNMVTLYHNLANANNYPANSITTSSISGGAYFTAALPSSGECMVTLGTKNSNESCVFSNINAQGLETLSVSYPMKIATHGNVINFNISNTTPTVIFSLDQQVITTQIPYYYMTFNFSSLYSSNDGINWSPVNLGFKGLAGLVYDSVGQKLFILVNSSSGIYMYSSTDGVYWQVIYSLAGSKSTIPMSPLQIDSSTGTLYFSTTDTLYSSIDHGNTWVANNVVSPDQYIIGVFALMVGDGKIASYLWYNSEEHPQEYALNKYNGVDWSNSPAFFPTPEPTNSVYMAFANNTFAALDSGSKNKVYITSTQNWDESAWNVSTIPINNIYTLASANNKFFALNNSLNQIATSTDGATWTLESLPINSSLSTVTYDNILHQYLMLGNGNGFTSSGNGVWKTFKTRGVSNSLKDLCQY